MHNILRLNKTGLKGNQTKMDGIAHNIANVNTHGYKRQEVSFEELRLRELGYREVITSDGADDLSLGTGTKAGYLKTTFKQGSMTPGGGKFNMAISGDGFFGVRDAGGNLLLTRNGNFHQNEDGSVSDMMGNNLELETYAPFESWTGEVNISKDGYVSGKEDGMDIELGRVVLFQPENLDNLLPVGDGNYIVEEGTILNDSTLGGEFGSINQFFLEESNVDMAKSMSDMIITQRAYSMNGKALSTSDEIMTMINGMKR